MSEMNNDTKSNLNYFKAYSLNKDPFDPLDIDSCFYKSPEIEHRLELIPHLAVFSDRIIQVYGEEGSGKTTMYNQLETLFTDAQLVAYSVSGSESMLDILTVIAKSLDIPTQKSRNIEDLLQMIMLSTSRAAESGKTVIIMIEDVQLLSMECIHMLLRLAKNDHEQSLCHLILLTSMDLKNIIQHPNLAYLHTIQLDGFSLEQVKAYLEYRLNRAEYSGDFPFSDKQIKEFYKTSNGLPGIINRLAVQAMSDPAVLQRQTRRTVEIAPWIFNPFWSYGISALVVVMSVSYVLVQENKKSPGSIEVSLPKKNSKPPEQLSSSVIRNNNELVNTENTEFSVTENAKHNVQNNEVIPIAADEQVIASSDEIHTADISPSPTNVPAPELELKQPEQVEIVQNQLSLEADSESEVQTKNQLQVESTKQPIDKVSDDPIETRVPANPLQNVRGADWLQNQLPKNYVLQLIGVHDPEILSDIIQRNSSLEGDLSRFATINSGKPWYVLVYGNFANREQAISAIPSLPVEIQTLKPWPRTIMSIHESINSSSE